MLICFYILVISIITTINIDLCIPFQINVYIWRGSKCQGEESLDYRKALFLLHWEIFILHSIDNEPGDTLTNSELCMVHSSTHHHQHWLFPIFLRWVVSKWNKLIFLFFGGLTSSLLPILFLVLDHTLWRISRTICVAVNQTQISSMKGNHLNHYTFPGLTSPFLTGLVALWVLYIFWVLTFSLLHCLKVFFFLLFITVFFI